MKRNCLNLEECKDIWLIVKDLYMNTNFNALNIYRHPNSNPNNFITKIDEVLSLESFSKKIQIFLVT